VDDGLGEFRKIVNVGWRIRFRYAKMKLQAKMKGCFCAIFCIIGEF
jgi:hypothetical protein